jgi:hypothetical protein
MTDHDRKEFAQLCALMSQALDRPMSKALIGIYFDGLKDFDIEQVASAVNQAVRTKTFMPKVAELRQLIEGAVDDRAAQAWAGFLEAAADGGQSSVRFADQATARAMDAVFGGWVQACRLLSAGGTDERGRQVGGCSDEMLASYQKQFARQYVAALHAPREAELYRPGLSEMSMREGSGSWSLRIPTLDQPVIYVGAGRTVTLRLTFDVAQGRLTDGSRAKLESGWDQVAALAADETRQLKAAERRALPPAPGEEMPTQEEVGEIKAAIAVFARKTSRLSADVAQTSSEAQESPVSEGAGD